MTQSYCNYFEVSMMKFCLNQECMIRKQIFYKLYLFQYQKELMAKAAGLTFVTPGELQDEYRQRQSTTDEDEDSDDEDEVEDDESDESEYEDDEVNYLEKMIRVSEYCKRNQQKIISANI